MVRKLCSPLASNEVICRSDAVGNPLRADVNGPTSAHGIVIPGLVEHCVSGTLSLKPGDFEAGGDDAHPAESFLSLQLVFPSDLEGLRLHLQACVMADGNEQLLSKG